MGRLDMPARVVCGVLAIVVALGVLMDARAAGSLAGISRAGAGEPAAGRFVPYRITTLASYAVQPDGNLPAATAATIGRHLIVERMAVRDTTHYRVDVQTVQPGIDAGTLTVTVGGRTMTAYDSRTGEAASASLSGWIPRPTDIQLGLQLQPMAPMPEIGQPFRQYLTSLHGPATVTHPTARVVGHTRLLGHPAAIIDFGPLIGTGPPTCTGPSRRTPHRMCFSRTGTGRARMWVATDHAALLRDTEGHFSGMRQHYLYRVTSLQIGPVPLSATRYAPPVRTRTSAWLQTAVIGGGDSGWFSGWPETWRTGMLYRAPPPHDSRGRQYTEDGVSIRRDTLTPIPSTIGVLYYLPKPSVLPLMPPAQYRGSGPYVYLQERIQVRGLPAALRHGRALRRGHCTVWAGSYGKGAPWVVLARQNLALLASTNALTQQDLLRYAFASLC